MINKTGATPPNGPDPKYQARADADDAKVDAKVGPNPKRGGVKADPLTFLGMYFDSDDAQKLWSVITQNICNAIGKDQQKAVDAIKKMKDDPDQDS